MTMRRSGLTLAACLLAAVICVSAGSSASTRLQGTIGEGTFASSAGVLAYAVYLPPNYATSGRRYPVIYYLHGLPGGPGSFRGFVYLQSALERTGMQAIVEGVPPGFQDCIVCEELLADGLFPRMESHRKGVDDHVGPGEAKLREESLRLLS